MKNLKVKISFFSLLITFLCEYKYSLANPNNHMPLSSKIDVSQNNIYFHAKYNDFENESIKKIKTKAYNNFNSIKNDALNSPKVLIPKNSNVVINYFNKENLTNKFKSSFKDLSSTFISNYGALVERAPDESLKTCTNKACYE